MPGDAESQGKSDERGQEDAAQDGKSFHDHSRCLECRLQPVFLRGFPGYNLGKSKSGLNASAKKRQVVEPFFDAQRRMHYRVLTRRSGVYDGDARVTLLLFG